MNKITLGEIDHRFGSLGSAVIHLMREIVSNQNEIIDRIERTGKRDRRPPYVFDTKSNCSLKEFREHIQYMYRGTPGNHPKGDFGEILCYEIHSQPDSGRPHPGLTFKELAIKWNISVSFLGELIADHCKKLEPLEDWDGGFHRS